MPIYEYACTNCGERTEAKQSFSDPPLEECPHCGGKLRKLYSPVGIVFKGTGFYATDARRSAAAGDEAKTGSKADSKTDPKTDPKGEKKDPGTKSAPKASDATPSNSGASATSD